MRLDATPLRPQFAAKITGIDLGKRIDDELQRAIERAMDEYAVCVLPDQTLQDEQQVAFSRFYGPLEMSPRRSRPTRAFGTTRSSTSPISTRTATSSARTMCAPIS
jgi:alpha-ketoglutarate-dependent taurine dioxygenase